jgi:hypothetical protein
MIAFARCSETEALKINLEQLDVYLMRGERKEQFLADFD